MDNKKIKEKTKKFFHYLFSKETISLWLFFLIYVSIFCVANYFYLPTKWWLIDLFIILSLFLFLFLSDFLLKLKNEEVEKEKNYTAGIINDLLDAVVAYDKDFLVTVFNPAAERMFDIKKEEILGKYITPALASNPKFRLLVQVIFPSLAPAIRNKTVRGYQEEYDLVFDDPYREFHVAFNRILDEKQKPLGFVKIIHEATREKELIKEKGEFLDIAAHNLNTPITELRWGLEALLEEAKTDKNLAKYKETMEHLESVAKNLSEIVADVLAVTRIEKGRFGYNFQETDIVELIEKDLEKWAPIAKRYQLKLFFEKPKSPLPKIHLDPLRIKMVLDNLVENAIIYNVKNGEITVKVEKLKDKPFIVVSVKDTGIGIPDEEKEKIFQKLFRGKKAVKYRTDGIGLGLYISRNIIRRHGGEMWFDSVEGRGSVFYFSLPTKKELIPPLEIPIV